jgi:hypothetical protein
VTAASTTAVVIIGNSDDKLSQLSWAAFCAETAKAIHQAERDGAVVHFHGTPPGTAPWQNAAWALLLPAEPGVRDVLRAELQGLAGQYGQESVAWIEACPEFLTPKQKTDRR